MVIIAASAWTLKSLAGSVMFPIAIGEVVSYFSSGGKGEPIMALMLLTSSVAIHVGVEWAFLPYYSMFVGSKINEIRKYLVALIGKVNRNNQSGRMKGDDLHSQIVSDVEFVMLNTGNSIATIISTSSSAVLALITMANANVFMAGFSLLLPFYLIVIKEYSKKVFTTRMEERKIYSNMINLSGEIVHGGADEEMFDDVLKRHNKAIYKLQFLERVNFASLYFLNGFGQILLLVIGAHLVTQNVIDVGKLVTIILAANAFFGATTNVELGLTQISQAVPAAKRIEGSIVNLSAILKGSP